MIERALDSAQSTTATFSSSNALTSAKIAAVRSCCSSRCRLPPSDSAVRISGSRLPSAFLVDGGAAMIVASTIVPLFKNSRDRHQ